jgi:glucose-1-phosphate cytidylyltransferase
VNVKELVRFHKNSGKLATLTAIQTMGRFGALEIGGRGAVKSFREKPAGDGAWINGGFFVLEPRIFGYLENDATVLERGPLERLARENKLAAYKHSGFWKCMDTLRDKLEFEKLWKNAPAPWKKWK